MSITLRSDFDVDLIEHIGSDQMICRAARVSTLGADSLDTDESSGLINFLMKNRHGSPFEHGAMIFRITCPIFLWREFMRHRIGVSYNEESGRYKVLDGVFYVPSNERPLVQVGKPGHYDFIPGDAGQHAIAVEQLEEVYKLAWDVYQYLLRDYDVDGIGVAKEVARMCLPVAIYSTAYVTMNPRSIMHFLSLRTKREGSTFPSYPQWEINQVANKIEEHFSEIYPLTYQAFHDNGRVCP